MDIKYRIIAVDTKEHSIVVRYFTDTITEEMLATELDRHGNPVLNDEGFPVSCRTDFHINIFQTPSPTQEEIFKIINANAPIEWLKLKEKVEDPNVDTSLSTIADLVNVVGEVDTTPPPLSPLGMLSLGLIDANTFESYSNTAPTT